MESTHQKVIYIKASRDVAQMCLPCKLTCVSLVGSGRTLSLGPLSTFSGLVDNSLAPLTGMLVQTTKVTTSVQGNDEHKKWFSNESQDHYAVLGQNVQGVAYSSYNIQPIFKCFSDYKALARRMKPDRRRCLQMIGLVCLAKAYNTHQAVLIKSFIRS